MKSFFKELVIFIKDYKLLTIIIIGICLIPFILYFARFGISTYCEGNKADWGTFGDFIGGFLNTILTFILLVFSIWSFYQSQKSTLTIGEEANKLTEQANRISEKVHADSTNQANEFHKQLVELQKYQVIPYLDILTTINDSKFTSEPKFIIRVKNAGLGPAKDCHLILTKPKNTTEQINKDIVNTLRSYNGSVMWTANLNGITIGVNEEVDIICAEVDLTNSSATKENVLGCVIKLLEIFKEMKYTLNYNDLYDNPYTKSGDFTL